MRQRLGFTWASILRGLWLGSAIGLGFTLAQYAEHYLIA